MTALLRLLQLLVPLMIFVAFLRNLWLRLNINNKGFDWRKIWLSLLTGKSQNFSQGFSKDPFVVLGLDRDASVSEIKIRYRELVQMYHPDRHPEADENFCKFMAQKLQEVQQAYEQIRRSRGF